MAETYEYPTEAPTGAVTSLSISRVKDKVLMLTAKWKVPSILTTKSGEAGKRRTTHVDADFVVDLFRPGKKKDPKDVVVNKKAISVSTTERTINMNNLSGTKNGKTVTLDRRDFFPLTSTYVSSVTAKVTCLNYEGSGSNLKRRASKRVSKATYKFGKPLKPKVSALTQNEDTGHVTCTITAYDDKDGQRERYNTRYQIEVLDGFYGKSNKNREQKKDGVFTGSSLNVSPSLFAPLDAQNRTRIGYDKYIRMRVRAMSQGIAGISDGHAVGKEVEKDAWTDWKTLYISYPDAPKIKKIGIPDTKETSKVTVRIDVNKSTKHPVTGVRLQKLCSSTAKTAAEAIAAGDDWEDVDNQDDGECTALALSVQDLPTARGTHTWVRVKTWNQFENIFYRFSAPKEIKALYKASEVGDDTARVLSVTSDDNGTSLAARIGWKVTGDPDTGLELSWSDDENAWKSTTGPETFELEWTNDWQEGPDTIGNVTYQRVTTIHIPGLTMGTEYHVKARTYREEDGDVRRTYSKYCAPEKGTPVTSPTSVTLLTDTALSTGSDLSASWTFDSDAEQKEWSIITGETYTTTTTEIDPATGDPITRTHLWVKDGVNGKQAVVLASGTDPYGSTTVKWGRLSRYVSNGTIPLAARVSTGGSPVASEAVTVTFSDPPTVELDLDETVTEQPFTFGMSSNAMCRLTIIMRAASGGVGGEDSPSGRPSYQAEGDVVWQTAVTPSWTVENPQATTLTYVASIDTPFESGILPLRQNGIYSVTIKGTDTTTGLESEEVVGEFTVDWAHKAPQPPEDDTMVEPFDVTDAAGVRTRGAVIHVVAPQTALATDVYDVYRLTPDGAYLVAQDAVDGMDVTDDYAPYGGSEKGYRIACRTKDGDEEWCDYLYDLRGKDMRIDFGGRYVELPYNLAPSDTYAKDFEARRKLSGDIDGYWNEGASRTASVSTDLIRIYEQEKAALVRELARYAGPAFVRLPDGCAFTANVDVNSIGGARRESALAVTITASEVALTEEYMAFVPIPEDVQPDPDPDEPEDGDEP